MKYVYIVGDGQLPALQESSDAQIVLFAISFPEVFFIKKANVRQLLAANQKTETIKETNPRIGPT
ncbi:hypothetical protein D9M72_589680 [compost metagenome]